MSTIDRSRRRLESGGSNESFTPSLGIWLLAPNPPSPVKVGEPLEWTFAAPADDPASNRPAAAARTPLFRGTLNELLPPDPPGLF